MSDFPKSPISTPHRLRGADLTELYPKAKTYEDILADKADRARRTLGRRPRFLAVGLTVRLMALAAAAALIVVAAPAIIFSNIIAGMFGVVLLVIMLLGACKWQADEITGLFDRIGLNAGGFLVLSFVVLVPLSALGLFAMNTRISGAWLAGGYVALFGALLIIVGMLLRKMKQ